MNNFGELINDNNVSNVRKEIDRKLKSIPYYATQNVTASIVTDMDSFPYTRYYRGVYNSPKPTVFEREAGWRVRNDGCYSVITEKENCPYPNHCFEAPCSTVWPCYPEYLKRYADLDALNIILNKACIVQYR